jgi:hypothetical protein
MGALDTQVGGNHYLNGGIQPVQYIEANKLQFLEASVVKRMTRHDKPGGKGRQDIEKAIHELQLLLELRYPNTVAINSTARPPCLVCGDQLGHGGLVCPNMRAVSSSGRTSDALGVGFPAGD